MKIFLSASVPLPDRDRAYFDTADVIAIRDSIKALAQEVLLDGSITFGGHPAITPLMALILRESYPSRAHSLVLYQSAYFAAHFPVENDEFIDVRVTPAVGSDRTKSLALMRREMLNSSRFDAGVFVGGMEGVEEEYELFRKAHPTRPAYPIASTGGAALIVYNGLRNPDRSLIDEITYPTLFRRILRFDP